MRDSSQASYSLVRAQVNMFSVFTVCLKAHIDWSEKGYKSRLCYISKVVSEIFAHLICQTSSERELLDFKSSAHAEGCPLHPLHGAFESPPSREKLR